MAFLRSTLRWCLNGLGVWLLGFALSLVQFAILATVAKQERIRLSERTKAGLAIARSRGKVIGRPRLQVKPADIARMRSEGHSLRSIGRTLGVSERSIRRMTA